MHMKLKYISPFFINCKTQTSEEKDYIINKAKNEKAVLILFPCFPCDKENTKSEALFLDKIENEGITTVLLDYNKRREKIEQIKTIAKILSIIVGFAVILYLFTGSGPRSLNRSLR